MLHDAARNFYLVLLLGRACRADGDPTECEVLRAEAASLRGVLASQLSSLAGRD
jgi:hypothetical protein